jgi:hypothetical protein
MMLSAKNNCKCKKCSKIKQLYQTLGGPDHHIGAPTVIRGRVEAPGGLNGGFDPPVQMSPEASISSSI